MAEGKQVVVDLTFNANVDNAKKAMKSLLQDLNTLNNAAMKNASVGTLNKDLLTASKTAIQLRQNLETAFNVKTGNLDLVKFNQSMKSAGMSLEKYRTQLMNLGPAGAQSFAQLSMAIMQADAPLTRVNSKLHDFAVSLKNTAKWQISSSILHGLIGSINSAYSYAQNLNASLNNIRIVTGASTDEMSKFATEANKAAKSLSTSTKTYADAALIFYQQGLGDKDVKERTDAVIKMANVTKDSAAEVSSYMTAIWNNFDDGSKSLEHYADVMTALGAATASSTAEIADGLEKFASIGKTIGLSYDYATSALATIVSQTRQSADTVGTGLRTIFSRLQGLSLGETLEDGVDLNKYSKALNSVGVQILDASGNMKNMDTILDSLAGKWTSLSQAQKTALAQTVGGVRQYTTLISLMDNWDSMETNLATAKGSSGTLQEQANIYAESWDAAKDRVRASAEAIYSSLINDKFFISLNNGFAGFLDQISNLIDGLGGLKGVLLTLTPIVTKLFRDQITSGLRNTIISLQALTPKGKKEIARTQQEAIEQTAKMYEGSATPSGYAMADQYRRTAKVQQAYLDNQRSMSDENRRMAQESVARYNETFGERVRAAGERVDQSQQAQLDAVRASQIAKRKALRKKDSTEGRKEIEEKRAAERARLVAEIDAAEQAELEKDYVRYKDGESKTERNNKAKRQEKIRDKYRKQREEIDERVREAVPDATGYEKKYQAAEGDLIKAARAQGFQEKAEQIIKAKVDVDTEDVTTAKQELQTLIDTIRATASEQGIDLETTGFAAALSDLEEKAQDADATLQDLRDTAASLGEAVGLSMDATDIAQNGSEEENGPEGFERTAMDTGMDADTTRRISQDLVESGTQEGADILEIAVASQEAQQAAQDLEGELNNLGNVKVDFASGFTTSISAISAVGAAISSVTGLMDVWGDSSASVGEKVLTTVMTLASVAGSLGSAFDSSNRAILKSMATALAAKRGWFGLSTSMTSTAAAAPVAGDAAAAAGSAAAAGGRVAQLGWWEFTLVLLAVVAVVAVVVGIFAGLIAVAQSVADAYNADAIAAEKAAETARALGDAYTEAANKYQNMIDTMDQYTSARAALDSLTEGTQAYNEALAEANEAGLALINSTSGLKRGEDYRWENGELIIDQDAMDRVRQEESERVAQARAASLMADANAAEAKAKAEQTAFVRKDDVSGWGGFVAGAAAGAGTGAMFGGPLGAAIGGVIGGIAGLGLTLQGNSEDNKTQNNQIDKLTKQYEIMGEKAFDDANLKALGFDTANKAYIDSLKEVVEATVAAADQTSNAARLAAQEILSTDEAYQRLDAEEKDRLGAASGRMYQTYQAEAEAKYLKQAQSRGWLFNTGDDESKAAWKKYADLTGLDELNGYKVENYAGNGDDARVEYSYIDDDGERQTREVTAQQIAAELAAAEAAEKLGQSTEFLISEFNRLEGSTDAVDKALSDFLAGDMTQASKSEAEAISDAFNGDHEIDASQASSYLATKFGDGKGILTDDEAKQYGYESAAAMAAAFQEEYNNTMKAWDSIELPEGIGEWGENLSLEAAQSLENTISELNLGPMGEAAGEKFIAGLNTMLAGVKSEDQAAALNQLMAIDWSDWDALSQADVILQEFGVDIDLTSQEWLDFAESMRIAARAVPDFSKLKSNLNSISKILSGLEFGDAIDEDDYNTLVEYNQEWSKFFVTQADGSRKFIGDAKAMAVATKDLALEHKNLLETYSAAAENDDISSFNWDQKITEETLDQAKSDFEALRSGESGAILNSVLEARGYDEEAIQAAFADPEKMQAMFDTIYEAIDPAYLDQIDTEFQEMFASTATTVEELQQMLSDGAINEGTYTKSLLAMASGYEYCASAVQAYHDAVASGDADAIKAAEENLEAVVLAEEAVAKLNDAYSHALSGKSSMTVEDLNLLKETNSELYDSFLTTSDDEWYEAAYQAQADLLESRMAGYAQDSAEYAALMMQKQQLDQEYYSSLEDKANEAADIQKQKWEDAISAAESAMSASSDFMSGDISFTNIEEFKQNMIDAGVETERVTKLIEGLSNVGTNTEQIKTAMVAASEAALAKLDNLNEQQQEYTGLVTNLDVSKVEPGNIEMHGNLGNGKQVTDEVQGAIDAANPTITADADADNVTSDIENAVTNADGTKIITMSDGSTISGDISTAVLNADGTKTITMDDGSSLSGDIVSAITTADGSKIITYADGSTLSGDISNVVTNANGAKVITYADGSTLSGDIASAVVNADGTKTIVMDGNNSTLSGDIVSAINATDGSIVITMSDGSETSLPAEVVAALSGNGKVFDVNAYLANPESLQDTINNLNLTAEVDVKLNLAQQALDAMKSTLMTGLSPDELQEVMKYSSMSNDEILAALTEDNRSGWEKFWGTGQGSQIRWSSSDKAALTQMVSNMIDLSPDEIAAQMMDPNSLLNSLLKALNAAVESGDKETADMAMFLLEGLGQGLSAGCSSFNWDACLTALGPEVSAAFKSALGIHSPSTLTQALAPYLFEGLAVGIAKCDASFTVPALPGVAGAVARAFSEAIKIGADGIDVSALNGIVDEDLLTDFTQRRQFMDEHSEVDETTGEAEWETIIGDQAWEDALDAEAARAEAERKAQLSALDSSKPQAISYEGEMITPSEAGEQARADAAAAGVIDGKTREQIRQEAIDNYMQEYMDVSSEIITDFSMDYFKNKKWLEDDTMSTIQKAAISGAVETAMKEMQITEDDLPVLSEEQQAQFVDLVQTNLNKSGEKIAFEIDKTWAEIKDIWISGLDAIYQAETELAEKTFSLWESTFNAIAKARLGLMDDKSILESMFGDPDGVSDIIESYLNAGYQMEDILEMLKNPDAQLDFTPFDLESYHKSGPQRFLNTDENGNYTVNTSLADYNANVDEYVTEQLGPHLADVIGDTLTQDQIAQMKTSGNAEELAFIKFLEDQGIIDASGNLLEGAQVLTDVLDRYAQSLYLDTQQEVNAVQANAVSTQQTEYYKRANTLQQEGEQLMSQKESDKSLLETARQMKLSGESLSTLTAEEQARLLELTGASSLSAISLETLNTATIECANAMLTCAQQIAVAMGMIQSGQADSWTIDPKTGQVTVSKNITYGDRGSMDIDTDTQARVDQVYSDSMANAGYTKTGEQWYRNGEAVNTSTDTDWQAANASATTAMNSTVIGSNDIQLGEFNAETDGARIKGTDLEAGLGAVTDADVAILKDYADALGMTTEEFDDYAKSLYENAETGKEWVDLTEEEKREAREFAVQAGRISNAWVDLTENQENNIKTLKKGQKGTTEYRKALGSLQRDIKTIFGDAEEVTSDFVEEHLDDIEKMAKGDEEAAQRVEKALVEDIMGKDYNIEFKIGDVSQPLGDVIRQFDDTWAHLENGAIITPEIDQSGITAGLLDIVNGFGAASASAIEAMSAIGYNPVIEMTEVPLQDRMSGSGQVTVPKVDFINGMPVVTSETRPITAEEESSGVLLIPSINADNKPKITGFQKTGGGSSGIRSPGRRGGGGGGGGGREARRANKINKEDNIERYHEIDNIIDDLADAYERLNKEEDRAWGKNRINAMQQESKILKEQIVAVEEKIRQAKQWKEQDLSAALSAGWTFDANGNVNNYDEFLSSQVDKYNAAIDSYNNMSAGAQEDLDKKYSDMTNKDGEYYSGYEDYLKQTLIDDPKEALEQYEETMELLEDLGMEYDDFLNEWHDNIIGQIQTKLDTTLEITEAQLGYLEHKLSRIEDDAYRAAEAIGLMGQQMDIAQAQFNAQKSALDDLLKAYSPEGTVWSAEDLMNGNISAEDLANAGMQSGDIELIQTIMEGLMDASEQMSEQMVNSIEHMANAFEEFNADMDRYISTVEHAQAITSTYRNIIDLTGRTMSGFNSTMLKSINDAIAAQSVAKLETNKTKYETIKTEYDEAKAAYEAAQASYAEGGIDAAALKAAKDTYQAAQDNMNEAQEAFLSSWEEALQAAADAFQSNMEAAVRDIGEMMSGGLAGGLAELEDAFAKMNEQDQNYVDDYEKIYQLTKMTRDLNDKIDSTSNVRAQKELLKYQKELNGLLESDQEMSAYDLDYLKKKLDLKLAEVALDEAQNAKSQVTMRRDSEGNYNYVYTADENAVAKAESDYADKLYEMQKANDEYITSLSENMANLSSQMLSEIAAIDTTIYDTEEKYQAEVQRITDHYTSQMEYYNSEMNKVLGNNKDLYEKDWTNFSKYTGYKLSAEENYVTKWSQTVLSQVTGFETQEGFYQNFNEAIFGGDPAHPSGESLIGRLVTAYKTMREQIAAANAAAGVETEDLATALLGNIEAATQEAEAAADGITEAATDIVNQIVSIGDAVTNMVNNYSQAMATMEAKTDAMLGVLLDFLTAYGEIGDLDIDPGVLAEIEARRRDRQENPEGYDTGGYTGAWGTEGRLAYLHQKELVLNAEDTANMLTSIGILRQIASVIDLNALASAGGFISLMSSGVAGNQGTLQQEVHIEANFPAVTDKNQIEEAFGDLVNLAAQYANRKV